MAASSPSKKRMSKGSKNKAKMFRNGAESTRIQLSKPTRRKRRNCSPGVRLVGSRIYDSKNGKTCHQCRQKTIDFVASCKKKNGEKQCTIHFCHKCLLNRYGEKAEEVALLDDWLCPRCRGICNCSFCMKKRGQQPTGILVHTAKANGFASVLEMLHLKNSESSIADEETIHAVVSRGKRKGPKKESRVAVTSKRRKGIIHEGKNDSVQTNDKRTETRNTKQRKLKSKASDVRIQLPQGIMLNGIAAIDLPTRDVAHALQFLEFCEAFREKIVEREKEKELLAQKEKERNLEKDMKKRLQDEIARAILMNNGAPLSISEHEDLVSRIKLEVAQTIEVAHTLANTLVA
ncbi:hypothetical protein SLEP1_g34580 [Rubroshorea leprosula]|uniref:Zinc-finger domain-containing protein n=1 Tax=Rubroshorea leprosula TaxID=152421 RepID=A0AAV5KKL8_9ROSI|nr:hypothetical protein SLEP1_g34580 [Rubroshorea leprosula]